MEKLCTCCFTGHRKLPKNKIEIIISNMNEEVDNLIKNGITNFICGGALGFDQIAASLIIAKKEVKKDIRLILALPCKNQDKGWSSQQKVLYYNLLAEADEVIYISEEYTDGCMKRRNYYMVEHSKFCICALLYNRSGTAQTVRYAKERNVVIINLI